MCALERNANGTAEVRCHIVTGRLYLNGEIGSGVYGWETEEEEDIWDVDLDFVTIDPDECEDGRFDTELTIGELMEWRYLRAEREKEQVFNLSLFLPMHVLTFAMSIDILIPQGNVAFKQGDYLAAAERYKLAHQIEPEMPHYQLNLAAAYLNSMSQISL